MEKLPKLEKSFVEQLVKEPVNKFTIKKGSAVGDNVAGDIYAIEVHTTSGKTLHLIYKILPENNPMLMQYAIDNKIFQLEIDIYTTVAQKVEALVKSVGFKNQSQLQLPIPKFYGGNCDGVYDFLVLEDERPNGYVMPNKYAGFDFGEMELILKELARFHAFTYFLIKHRGEQLFEQSDGMRLFPNGFWNLDNAANMAVSQALYGGAFEVALKVLESSIDVKLAEIVKSKVDTAKVGQMVRQVTRLTDTKMFPVILHGDFWTNNILIKYEDAKPTSVKFIDFQQTRRGNIFEDLLYFIFTSTTAKFRKKHLVQVLSIYFDTFTSIVAGLAHCPCPANFTKGRFFDMFYECYVPTYIYMAFAIPLQLGSPGENDMEQAPDENPFPALMKRLDKLYKSNSIALLRLEEITREFVDLGIF